MLQLLLYKLVFKILTDNFIHFLPPAKLHLSIKALFAFLFFKNLFKNDYAPAYYSSNPTWYRVPKSLTLIRFIFNRELSGIHPIFSPWWHRSPRCTTLCNYKQFTLPWAHVTLDWLRGLHCVMWKRFRSVNFMTKPYYT